RRAHGVRRDPAVRALRCVFMSSVRVARRVRLPQPLDLAATLQGGQAFRWRHADGSWTGVLDGAGARIAGDRVEGPADDAVRRYFRFEPEDAARRARLAKDEVLAPAVAAHPGLRLLRQDPWEATVAFITSANNNVLRIEGILDRVCARWGK